MKHQGKYLANTPVEQICFARHLSFFLHLSADNVYCKDITLAAMDLLKAVDECTCEDVNKTSKQKQPFRSCSISLYDLIMTDSGPSTSIEPTGLTLV